MTKVTRKSKAAAAAQQRGGGGGGGSGKGSKASAAQVTAAQLYQQAQIALRFDDYDAAKEALRRAVKLEPRNSALLDAYACLLAELGDDGAKAALQQAVTVAPASGHEKYFYLAQLEEEPATAIQCSSHGLALLQTRLQEANAKAAGGGPAKQKQRQQQEARALSKALCSALVSHAEMLLALACGQREDAMPPVAPNSEAPPPDPRQQPLDAGLVAQVEAALSQARTLQPHSPEPGQALAALRSEQGRSEEALAALRASMASWWDADGQEEEEQEEAGEQGDEDGGDGGAGTSSMQQDEAQEQADDGPEPSDMEAEEAPPTLTRRASQRHARSPAAPPVIPEGDEEGEEEDEDEDEEEDDVPSFEFRFECAKLLLELDDSTDTAVGVLHTLVEEYDSNPDAWHLLALALYSGHQYDAALETAVKGQELLRRLRVPKRDEHWASFAELVDAIKEAAGAAAAAAGAAGIKPGF